VGNALGAAAAVSERRAQRLAAQAAPALEAGETIHHVAWVYTGRPRLMRWIGGDASPRAGWRATPIYGREYALLATERRLLIYKIVIKPFVDTLPRRPAIADPLGTAWLRRDELTLHVEPARLIDTAKVRKADVERVDELIRWCQLGR
jgi:hypothetical protein